MDYAIDIPGTGLGEVCGEKIFGGGMGGPADLLKIFEIFEIFEIFVGDV